MSTKKKYCDSKLKLLLTIFVSSKYLFLQLENYNNNCKDIVDKNVNEENYCNSNLRLLFIFVSSRYLNPQLGILRMSM